MERLRSPQASATLLRSTNLFTKAVRSDSEGKWYANHLIHRTAKDVLVQSKSEVIVADTLTRLGISYEYEKKLLNKEGNPNDYRLPDFTVSYDGDIFFIGSIWGCSPSLVSGEMGTEARVVQE